MANKDIVTKATFKEADIESSSDFIVTLWAYSKVMDQDLFLQVDPIYRMEYANWHDTWDRNVSFIEKKMQNLDVSDYMEIYQAYTDVMNFFFENLVISNMYKMDDKDHLGWKIFHELSEKRAISLKLLNITKYF